MNWRNRRRSTRSVIPAGAPVAAGFYMTAMAAIVASTSAEAQPPGAPGRSSGPLEVGVVEVTTQTVPYVVTVPGRAVAYEQTTIRPRVGGVISEIVYSPERPVKQGDVLFRIDDDTYSASVASAEAEVESATAEQTAAEATLARYKQLEDTGVTKADVEAADVAVAKAKAAVSLAEAALEVAKLDLERTEIRSPIDGVAAVPTVSIGAIVTANQADALTTVTRLDPIYVDVEESSARIQRIRKQISSGVLEPDSPIKTQLTLEDGSEYDKTGTVVVPGRLVSTTTGTTDIRVQFDNPERLIMPGQFLRIAATLGTTQAMLVPQGATSRTADGTLTAFVVRDGKASLVDLDEAGTYENAWIITGGIEAGDQLIVDNLRNLKNGSAVQPTPVTISSDGVIEDKSAPASDSGAPTDDSGDPGTPAPAQGG